MPTLTRDEYFQALQKSTDYQSYKGQVGSAGAQGLGLASFQEELRKKDAAGLWSAGAQVARGVPAPPDGVLKFKDQAGLKGFKELAMLVPFILDLIKIRDRRSYLGSLAGRARSDDLRRGMNDATEPESNYYVAASPAVPAVPPVAEWGAMKVKDKIKAWPPAKPATTPAPVGKSAPAISDAAVRAKAKAWLTATNTPAQAHAFVDQYARSDGGWPLGGDATILKIIWRGLVQNAPAYRAPLQANIYPSNFGGMRLLEELMSGISREALPAHGDPRWANWALYTLGGAMAVQGFTDGNKRVCRTAYAIVMVAAGIDFRAPTDRYGSQLAQML